MRKIKEMSNADLVDMLVDTNCIIEAQPLRQEVFNRLEVRTATEILKHHELEISAEKVRLLLSMFKDCFKGDGSIDGNLMIKEVAKHL